MEFKDGKYFTIEEIIELVSGRILQLFNVKRWSCYSNHNPEYVWGHTSLLLHFHCVLLEKFLVVHNKLPIFPHNWILYFGRHDIEELYSDTVANLKNLAPAEHKVIEMTVREELKLRVDGIQFTPNRHSDTTKHILLIIKALDLVCTIVKPIEEILMGNTKYIAIAEQIVNNEIGSKSAIKLLDVLEQTLNETKELSRNNQLSEDYCNYYEILFDFVNIVVQYLIVIKDEFTNSLPPIIKKAALAELKIDKLRRKENAIKFSN